jgi:hypothetical protein
MRFGHVKTDRPDAHNEQQGATHLPPAQLTRRPPLRGNSNPTNQGRQRISLFIRRLLQFVGNCGAALDIGFRVP